MSSLEDVINDYKEEQLEKIKLDRLAEIDDLIRNLKSELSSEVNDEDDVENILSTIEGYVDDIKNLKEEIFENDDENLEAFVKELKDYIEDEDLLEPLGYITYSSYRQEIDNKNKEIEFLKEEIKKLKDLRITIEENFKKEV